MGLTKGPTYLETVFFFFTVYFYVGYVICLSLRSSSEFIKSVEVEDMILVVLHFYIYILGCAVEYYAKCVKRQMGNAHAISHAYVDYSFFFQKKKKKNSHS